MLLIKNGTVITDESAAEADILIENGVIAAVGKGIVTPPASVHVIDASGKLIFPGMVDVHTHFNLDTGAAAASDDFFTGTVAAACGGTTTIIDHIGFGPPGCGLRHQIDKYHSYADGNAVTDYGFHGVIQHVNDDILDEMAQLIEEGITSYKIYMTYGFKLDDFDILRVMAGCKQLGVMLAVHPENDGVIAFLRDFYRSRGLYAPVYHSRSRPAQCEAEAVNRLVMFSEILGDVPLYIAHLSAGRGLEACEAGRRRGLKNLFIETCPQYLCLDESYYTRGDALKYILSPPLREKSNIKALWTGIRQGQIQTIATDHCPFPFKTSKQAGANDFALCPNGMPGVETRTMLIYSEGVAKGLITPNRFVRVCASNPAKLFGIYPKKGAIQPGSDADLIIIEPDRKSRVTVDDLHENVDYTPYEGFEITGRIEYTIARGEIIAQDGNFIGKMGRGRFLPRNIPALALA